MMIEFFCDKREDGFIEFGFETDTESTLLLAESMEEASKMAWQMSNKFKDLFFFLEKSIDKQIES